MEGPVLFKLGFEDSQAYAQINALASHARKSFANVGGNTNPFAALNAGANTFNRTLASTNDRFVAFAATASVVYGVSSAFKGLYSSAISVEKALAEIQVNVKTTGNELKSLSAGLFDVANATSQSFFTAAEAAAEFGRQGLKLSQVLKATQAALTLTQTTGLDSVTSVQTLTAAVNTFTKEGLTYADVVNKMAAADTSFAVSSKDLAEGVRRVGSTAIDANVSYEELLATITALQQKTSRGGGVIGNSLKTIFTRLQREGVGKELESLNINTKNSDGEFRNQLSVLKDIAAAYDNLSASQRASVSEMVGGVYQINIIKALFQDLAKETSVYSQALEVVQKSQNDAFAKSEFLSGTTASKINALKNSFVELGGEIGNLGLNDATKGIASELTGLLGSISEALSKDSSVATTGEQVGQSFVKGLIASITGPGLALFLRSMATFSANFATRVGGDIKNSLTPGLGKTQANTAARIEENRLAMLAIQAEKNLLQNILQGNLALTERGRILAANMAMQAKSGTLGSVAPLAGSVTQVPGRRIKNYATGLDPVRKEMAQIKAGVGGATRKALPIPLTIKTSPGQSERVIANTDEVLVKNYKGTGADAIFNRDMIRKIGGESKLSQFGEVRNLAGGSVPFDKRGPKELIKIMKGNNAIQAKGAQAALAKMGYFNKASSISLGIPASMLSERALLKGPQTGPVGQAIAKELARRGTLNDPSAINRGVSLDRLSKSAVGKIAKDTQYQTFSRAQVVGAQNLRNQSSGPAAAQRLINLRAQSMKNVPSKLLKAMATGQTLSAPPYVAAAQVARNQRAQAIVAQRQQQKAAAEKAARVKAGLKSRTEDRARQAQAASLQKIEDARAATAMQESKRVAASTALQQFVQQNPTATTKQISSVAGKIEKQFGAPVDKKEFKSARREVARNRNQQFASGSIKYAIGGSIIGSMVGDQIGGDTGQFVGSAINNASTLGSLGASFGPVGAGIGAGVGVFLALGDAVKKSTIPLAKFQKSIEDLGAKTEKQQSAISKYFTTKDNIKSLLNDPDADPRQIRNNIKEQASALSDLPFEMRKKVLEAPEKEQMGIAQEMLQKEVRKLNAGTALGSIASIAEKENTGTGLFWRKLTGNSKDDSRLKFGDIKNSGTIEKINSIVDSLVSNIDLKELTRISKDSKDPNSGNARMALDGLNNGDFGTLIRNLEGLNVIPEEIRSTFAKTTLNSISGAEMGAFDKATYEAKKRLDELNIVTERLIRAKELEKSAVLDFQRYLSTSTNRNAANQTLDSINNKVRGARLGYVSQDPATSGSFKNIISTALELSEMDKNSMAQNRSTGLEIAEFAKKLSLEVSKTKIDETLGSNFIPGILKDSEDPTKVPALLERLNTGMSKLTDVSADTATSFQKFSGEYRNQTAEARVERELALNQLKVLQSIEKKQKFDELINSYRQNSPLDRAFDELNFRDLKNEVFNPSGEERRQKSREMEEALARRDFGKLRDIALDKGNTARELLEENDKKVARGESGLSKQQIGSLKKDILRDEVINSFGLQSDDIKAASDKRNLTSKNGTKQALDEAEFLLARGGGSVQSSIDTIKLLRSRAGQISDPDNQNNDRKDLNGLADSLENQLGAQISKTGLFGDIDKLIAGALSRAGNGTSAKDVATLETITEQLGQGNLSGAGKSMASLEDTTLGDFLKADLGKVTPQKMQEAVDSNFKTDKTIDTAAALGGLSESIKGGLIPSQSELTKATQGLQSEIGMLTQVMQKEGRIAELSAKTSDMNRTFNDKEKELNGLIAERAKVMPINQKTTSEFEAKKFDFLSSNFKALKLVNESSGDNVSNADAERAKQFLTQLRTGAKLTPEEESKGFENLSYIRSQANFGVSGENDERQRFIQNYRRSLSDGETDKANTLDEQIKALNETLNALKEQIKVSSEEANALRKEPVVPTSTTGQENTAQTSNLSINVSGLDGSALASLKDDIAALVASKFKEFATLSKENPKLFNAMMG